MGLGGVKVNDAVGGALTVNCLVVDRTSPRSSVTRRPTVYVPAVANAFLAVFVVASPNTPSLLRSHSVLLIGPSGSVDVDLKDTAWPTMGTEGVIVKLGTGGWLATTVTVLDFVDGVMPSVTVSVTVCGPGVPKVVWAVAPDAGVPPRSHVWSVMVPVAAEVNLTTSPARGCAGAKVKSATGVTAGAEPATTARAVSPVVRSAAAADAARRVDVRRAFIACPFHFSS